MFSKREFCMVLYNKWSQVNKYTHIESIMFYRLLFLGNVTSICNVLFCSHLLPIPLTFPSLLPTYLSPNFISFFSKYSFQLVLPTCERLRGEGVIHCYFGNLQLSLSTKKSISFPPEIMNFQ